MGDEKETFHVGQRLWIDDEYCEDFTYMIAQAATSNDLSLVNVDTGIRWSGIVVLVGDPAKITRAELDEMAGEDDNGAFTSQPKGEK